MIVSVAVAVAVTVIMAVQMVMAVFVVGVFDGGAFVVSVVAVDDVRRHVSME